mmetsp:Transcript_31687/g.98659  ORF Transcript_31687/g.98659 Transcript_31687/m.98659 type:complete len:202 (+) Transcript_31687:233-838(+)
MEPSMDFFTVAAERRGEPTSSVLFFADGKCCGKGVPSASFIGSAASSSSTASSGWLLSGSSDAHDARESTSSMSSGGAGVSAVGLRLNIIVALLKFTVARPFQPQELSCRGASVFTGKSVRDSGAIAFSRCTNSTAYSPGSKMDISNVLTMVWKSFALTLNRIASSVAVSTPLCAQRVHRGGSDNHLPSESVSGISSSPHV